MGKKKGATKERAAAPPPGDGPAWIEAPGGYALALEDGKLVCRNPKGKRLASLPPAVRESEAAGELEALRDFLALHERECLATVESWMLRSLAAPWPVLESVWPDPAWRRALENAIVIPGDGRGDPRPGQAGILRGVERGRGLGLVDADGETRWVEAAAAALPHPILIEGLEDWRALAGDLGLSQGIPQLLRETFPRPGDLDGSATAVSDYAGGVFAQLLHALGRARSLGYRVRGGFATTTIWEGGRLVEARYWIGADSPEAPTWTGDLVWVDSRERALALQEVGPVPWSEGMRMASAIWAGRKVEEGDGGARP